MTGSSRGLGRQIAERALAAGHRVVATARDPRSLADLATRYGDRVHVERLDVTDAAAAEAAVAAGVAARSAGSTSWSTTPARATGRPSKT